MRILHISTRLILGGSQENTILSCEGQARRGHEVHLAYGPIYGPEGSLLDRVQAFNKRCAAGAERLDAGGPCRPIELHKVGTLVRAINPLMDLLCYGSLKRLIRRLKPDIVHTHSSKAGVLGRAAAWNVRKGPPTRPGVIHTIHGPPFHKYQSPRTHRLYVRAEKYAVKRCDQMVGVAEAMMREYVAEGIGGRELYVTVRSGMEVGAFLSPLPGERREQMRAALNLGDRDFVIGTVARLAELKGHDDLLDALGEDLKKNPNWKLLWVGDGWWRQRLITKARRMGLRVEEKDRGTEAQRRADGGGQVIVTGLVGPERIPGLIRSMDVLAHPSYREGLPRTVPQALLCGVCPVAYDVDGTGEVCIHGETGLLVPPGAKNELKGAIGWCYSHPQERRAMAEKGKVICAVEFAAKKMVEDLDRVYWDVLGRLGQ